MAILVPSLYRNCVTMDKNGKNLLYVKVLKSLYGLLKSELLFYKNISKYLESYVLKTNPYNPCV